MSASIAILAAIAIIVALSASGFSLFMSFKELSRRSERAVHALSPPIEKALGIADFTTAASLLGGLNIDPDVIGAAIIGPRGHVFGSYRRSVATNRRLLTGRGQSRWSFDEVIASATLHPRDSAAVEIVITYRTAAAWQRAAKQLAIFLGSGLGGLVLIALVVPHLLVRQMRPWRDLVHSMAHLVEARYEKPVPGLERRGEIGDMARAVDSFRTKLIDRESLRRQAEAAHREAAILHTRIDIRVDDFRKSIRMMLNEATGLSDQMTVAADGLKSIAAQTSERAEDVSSAIRRTSANVGIVADASEELDASIREIERQVDHTRAIVTDATRATVATSEVIKSLFAKTEEIGEIIGLIQTIAVQTNLLSLNAAIEAARAGESGRGFAVVAHEVKMLADQTTRASRHVEEHILAIQQATSHAVDAISEIDGTMGEAEKFSSIISVAVERQAIATAEISRCAADAARSAEVAAGSMKRLTSAVGETDQSAIQVHQSASDVESQARDLSVTVDQFLRDTASLRGAA